MALNEMQEVRAAAINEALQKKGADRPGGADRRALVEELSAILGVVEHTQAPLPPERQARLDQINTRLREAATGYTVE
jgi:hypothetical protein